jgi:hypothetical protein
LGPSSLRLEVKDGKSGNVHQTISGGANGRFEIAGWVKSQGNVKAQVAVHAFAEGWKNNKFMQVQYFQGDNDWMKFEKEVVLPEWTSFFYVTLMAEGEGKAWLDEVGAAGEKVDAGRVQTLTEIMTTQAPAKDKPSVAGWGFYPNFPTAWQQTFNGQLERTKQGREKKDINVVFSATPSRKAGAMATAAKMCGKRIMLQWARSITASVATAHGRFSSAFRTV